MGNKIGEVFVQKGLITEAQLEMALKAQLIYGGHLGTCLIELSLVDEETLGQTLSEISGVPFAPSSVLSDIPEGTIRSLSGKVAEEYQAIPLRVSNKVLHVAMVEPRNLRAIDELAFASGFRIEPWISPELRIFQALERYYGIPRRVRYITLCRALEALSSSKRTEPGGKDAARPTGADQLPDLSLPEIRAGGADVPSASAESGSLEAEAAYGYGKSWREIADELDPAAPSISKKEGSPVGASSAPPSTDLKKSKSKARNAKHKESPQAAKAEAGMSAVADRLCKADTTRDIITAILDETSTTTDRSLFFVVNNEAVALWDDRGGPWKPGARPRAKFSVTSEPLFELLLGESHFRGPLSDEPRYQSFYATLGMATPAEILLLPLYLNDRLVGIFYGDTQSGGKTMANTDAYLRLLRLVSISLSMVLLKQKIRASAQSREMAGAAETDQKPAASEL